MDIDVRECVCGGNKRDICVCVCVCVHCVNECVGLCAQTLSGTLTIRFRLQHTSSLHMSGSVSLLYRQ